MEGAPVRREHPAASLLLGSAAEFREVVQRPDGLVLLHLLGEHLILGA